MSDMRAFISYSHEDRALVEIAEWPETRAQWLGQYANRVVELGGYAMLRQRGAFSSFCIPDEEIDHQVWKDRVEICIRPRPREGSLTIIGDWFVAESRVPRPGGYRQTIFSWHAPTVLRAVRRFDEQFDALYARRESPGRSSRDAAVARIQQEIDKLSYETDSCGTPPA
ncbi:MAG: hypothetical protein JXP34_04690 [Planctomycetes bacterium]|nr:hypothetical protein [Planctomycetota bacterium]